MANFELSEYWTRFTHNGREFAAKLHPDDSHGAPWDEEDGHGDVTGWERRSKAPGELILSEDHRGRARRFYDFAGAVKRARAEGWNAAPYTGTRGECAARAVMADFEHLRAWCNGDWLYVGVIVAPVCPCCDEVQEDDTQSLWGIESDAGDYLAEVAEELAGQFAPEADTAAA